jgi:hypothetical protein
VQLLLFLRFLESGCIPHQLKGSTWMRRLNYRIQPAFQWNN